MITKDFPSVKLAKEVAEKQLSYYRDNILEGNWWEHYTKEELAREIKTLRGQYKAMEDSLEEYRNFDNEIKEENHRIQSELAIAWDTIEALKDQLFLYRREQEELKRELHSYKWQHMYTDRRA